MQGRAKSPLKILVLVLLATGILTIIGVNASDTTAPSSCVKCHTDEKALTSSLSPVKVKKSSMTSGTG